MPPASPSAPAAGHAAKPDGDGSPKKTLKDSQHAPVNVHRNSSPSANVSTPTPVTPSSSALSSVVQQQGVELLAIINRRVNFATKVASHFDSLRSMGLDMDSDCLALLDQIRDVITNFNRASTTPTKSSGAKAPNPRASPSTPIPNNAAVPSSPRKAAASENVTQKSTYAAVASRGAAAPSSSPKSQHGKSVNPISDQRIMVRLPEDSHIRSMSSSEALSVARSAVAPYSEDVKAIHFVKTGLALLPADSFARSRILSQSVAIKQRLNATDVEQQLGRDKFIVPFAPLNTSWTIAGPRAKQQVVQYTPRDYWAELTAVVGHSPLSVHMAPNHTPDTCTLFLTFTKGAVKPMRHLSLFHGSLSLVTSHRKPRLVQCGRCQHFHSQHGCTRPSTCVYCGSTEHDSRGHPLTSAAAEDNIPKCFHCRGPHKADYQECPARPRYNEKTGRHAPVSRAERGSLRAQQHLLRQKALEEWKVGQDRAANLTRAREEDAEMEDVETGDPEPTEPAAPPPYFPQSSSAAAVAQATATTAPTVVPSTYDNEVEQ